MLGHRELRYEDFAKLNRYIAALGNQPTVGYNFRVVCAPATDDIVWRGDVQFEITEAHSFFIAQEGACLHTK